MAKVKCADCGLLGGFAPWTDRRGNAPQAGSITELARQTRTEGTFRSFPLDPVCTVGLREFKSVMTRDMGDVLRDELQDEIECDAFSQWKPGMPPKEHREMLDRQWMHDQEDQRRTSDRKWHWAELVLVTVAAGAFVLLGAYIGRSSSAAPSKQTVPVVITIVVPASPQPVPSTVASRP